MISRGDRTVDVHIQKLRKKTGWENRIKTVYKMDTDWRQEHEKRTFYATFLLFLTAIYTSILSLSVITLKGTMQQARQQCLNEQYFIASALYRDMAALEDRVSHHRKNLTV